MARLLTLALAHTLKHALKQKIGLPVSCLLVAVWSFSQLAELAARLSLEYLLEGLMKVLAASGG